MRVAIGLSVVVGFLAAGLACAGQDAPEQEPSQQENLPQVERQPPKPPSPTGTLRGTVYCADTNLPARLAQIYVLQISQNSFSQRSNMMSDLDGRFAIDHVREGDYYVVAVLPGYVNLLDSLTKAHLDAMPAEDRKRLLAQVPTVTISADQQTQVSIRLERGAEIDGTVLFDDGSPAIDLQVDFKLKTKAPEAGSPLAQMMSERVYAGALPPMTDDNGHFRIFGVSPGEYVVSVKVPSASADHPAGFELAEMMESSIGALDVYVGGGLRASKAETIKVESGGASKDADITIPLSKLHTIHGQVVLKTSGQPPPAAIVQLLYADTRELARIAIAPNGEFEIHYVPEGSFILKAMAMPAPLPQMNIGDGEDQEDSVGFSGGFFSVTPDAREIEGGVETPLTVTGDVEHVSVTVPDPPANRQNQPGGTEEQGAVHANSGESSQ